MPLEPEAFERLLGLFDRDRARAGERYESIRRALVKFFEVKGGRFPHELADETLDRVARRLAEGEEVRAADPAAYVHGVARNVLRGDWARRTRDIVEPASGDGPEPAASDSDATRREMALACLDGCLSTLPPETRGLVLSYYADEGRAKIDARRDLAGSIGVALNALRIRMHRIRGRLESCVRACLAGETEGGAGDTGMGGEP